MSRARDRRRRHERRVNTYTRYLRDHHGVTLDRDHQRALDDAILSTLSPRGHAGIALPIVARFGSAR